MHNWYRLLGVNRMKNWCFTIRHNTLCIIHTVPLKSSQAYSNVNTSSRISAESLRLTFYELPGQTLVLWIFCSSLEHLKHFPVSLRVKSRQRQWTSEERNYTVLATIQFAVTSAELVEVFIKMMTQYEKRNAFNHQNTKASIDNIILTWMT